MAGPWFVRSLAAGAGTGADWANAFTTLTAANTASTAGGGETFWIADDHAESTAGAVTLTSKGAAATPNFYYCVDHTVASPGTGDLKTTGTLTTTGANAFNIQGGHSYYYGLTFINGNSGTVNCQIGNSADGWYRFDNCGLSLGVGTTAGAYIFGALSNQKSRVEFNNVTLSFNNASQLVRVRGGVFQWRDTASAVLGAAAPSVLFDANGQTAATAILEGVDLSAIPSGKTLITGTQPNSVYSLTRCKLASGVTVSSSIAEQGGPFIDLVQCDSGATGYRQERHRFSGDLTQETTIVRSGGASDGTTPISWKIVSASGAKWVCPLESFPIAIWNDVVGSPVTATVEIVAAGALNNGDVWMEVEYLGSTLTPQASFANSTKANNLATGTALTVSGATWASSPGAPQKMSVTFTPQMKGYIYIRIYVAKASQTLYVDPLVTLS